MNLDKLFKAQAELDRHIIEKKGLQGVDLLPNLILALQVELGECANEWRGFKHWSDDQEPRTKIETGICIHCAGTGNANYDDDDLDDEDCTYCGGVGEEIKNPLLEEYVDCLHFILSIGLKLYDDGIEETEELIEMLKNAKSKREVDITTQFRSLFFETSRLYSGGYTTLFEKFHGLGEMLGFTEDQIEQAYFEKNKVNHERQESGY